MKKNLFLRLCLMMAVAIFIYACRTDHLPENEISYNNSSKFQLTSKRISLSASKHKEKLVTELGKAEANFKVLSKINVNGRVIDYGNGVSIDTDDVAYIENGSDYHTYTFHITRENAPANAPIENLVLSPLPNGGYKALLISYLLSQQEKQIILNGGDVDTKGKSLVTDLGNGTFSDIMGKSQDCGYIEEKAYTICSENVHYHGETNCNADVKSQLITVYLWVCTDVNDGDGNTGGGHTGNNNGGGVDSGNPAGNTPTEPCNGNGVATEPVDPINNTGNGTCTGIPTDILLPHPNTVDPCKKTKASVTAGDNLLKEQSISTEVQSLENHAANSFTEYGMAIINTGTTTIAQDPYSNNDPNNPGTVTITIPSVGDFIASAHTHPDHGAAPPSVKDFYIAFQNAKNYSTFQANYVFAHNGTKYAFVVNDRAKAEAFLAAYPFETNTIKMNGETKFNKSSVVGKDFNEIYESYKRGTFPNYSGDDQNDGLESAFAYILEKYDMGISLAKSDSNGNLKSLRSVSFEHTISSSGGKKVTAYKAQPCP